MEHLYVKRTKEAVPRREEACAVCAVRDWLESRCPVRLFSAASGTTTWKKLGFALGDDANEAEEKNGGHTLLNMRMRVAVHTLLVALC